MPASSCRCSRKAAALDGFVGVVELAFERGDQLLRQSLDPDLAGALDPAVDASGDHAEHRSVTVHIVFDAGTLDLDHHSLAAS